MPRLYFNLELPYTAVSESGHKARSEFEQFCFNIDSAVYAFITKVSGTCLITTLSDITFYSDLENKEKYKAFAVPFPTSDSPAGLLPPLIRVGFDYPDSGTTSGVPSTQELMNFFRSINRHNLPLEIEIYSEGSYADYGLNFEDVAPYLKGKLPHMLRRLLIVQPTMVYNALAEDDKDWLLIEEIKTILNMHFEAISYMHEPVRKKEDLLRRTRKPADTFEDVRDRQVRSALQFIQSFWNNTKNALTSREELQGYTGNDTNTFIRHAHEAIIEMTEAMVDALKSGPAPSSPWSSSKNFFPAYSPYDDNSAYSSLRDTHPYAQSSSEQPASSSSQSGQPQGTSSETESEAFFKAVAACNQPVVETMLEKNKSLVNEENAQGDTPLIILTSNYLRVLPEKKIAALSLITYLLTQGAVPHKANKRGADPLYLAMARNDEALTRVLLAEYPLPAQAPESSSPQPG